MATGSRRSPELCSSHRYEEPETEFAASGSGRLPEGEAVVLVERPETETSDGDPSSNEQRRRRRRRKYGRIKRIRREALALPAAADLATESEKHFIVVDGPQVGIFRSPTSSSTAADGKRRSWFDRKLLNRNRKFLRTQKAETTTPTLTSRQRCERYMKQFIAALFSTLGLLCLMVAYTVLGGYVFSLLESSNEVNVKADMRQVTTGTLF